MAVFRESEGHFHKGSQESEEVNSPKVFSTLLVTPHLAQTETFANAKKTHNNETEYLVLEGMGQENEI